MKRDSKVGKFFIFVLILIIVSFNANQIITNTNGKNIVNTNSTYYNKDIESNNSTTESYLNETDYLISGDTGDVSSPIAVCLSNNEKVILWREGESALKIAKYDSNLSQVIELLRVINGSTLISEEFELSQPKMLVDTIDNLHLFWYIMDFNSPQQGNIYYLKMNKNLQIIIPSKIIHTYTHNGWGTSCFVSIFKSLFLDERDLIHLLVEDNSYYLLNLNGAINASTIVPEELGPVQDLVLDSDGNALIICGSDDYDSIYSIKYAIGSTTIIEQNRTLLFNTSGKIIFYTKLQEIGANLYFYWWWKNDTTYIMYFESYQVNSNGSLGELSSLNEHFFADVTYCMNSTHAVSLAINQSFYSPDGIYYSFFNPLENQSYIESKLLIRFLKNELYYYSPAIFDVKIILDKNSEIIISFFANDGRNSYQVFLWKITLDGTTNVPIVVVAPESQLTSYTPILQIPSIPLFAMAFIILIIIPKLLRKKT
ncbi:MAG: hypothetical protein FK730_03570 [Asgard group archaeon]|nr:hypothetical protein [Asgard group archaeon]